MPQTSCLVSPVFDRGHLSPSTNWPIALVVVGGHIAECRPYLSLLAVTHRCMFAIEATVAVTDFRDKPNRITQVTCL